MKENIMRTMKIIEKKFPGKPILPVFGSTDNLGNNVPPDTKAFKD